jgi:hypothetical protein
MCRYITHEKKRNLTFNTKLKAAIQSVWKQSYEVREDEIGKARNTYEMRVVCGVLVTQLEGK